MWEPDRNAIMQYGKANRNGMDMSSDGIWQSTEERTGGNRWSMQQDDETPSTGWHGGRGQWTPHIPQEHPQNWTQQNAGPMGNMIWTQGTSDGNEDYWGQHDEDITRWEEQGEMEKVRNNPQRWVAQGQPESAIKGNNYGGKQMPIGNWNQMEEPQNRNVGSTGTQLQTLADLVELTMAKRDRSQQQQMEWKSQGKWTGGYQHT